MPFVHMVWLQWQPHATPAQVAACGDAILALRAQIPQIVHIAFGRNLTARTPHSHGLVVVFERAEDLPVYDAHAAHQAVIREHIAPIKLAVAALDFACDAPLSGAGARFVHQVWFDFSGASEAQLAAAQAGLLGMRESVPGVVDVSFGRNVTTRTTHTHGLLVTFAREADYTAYERDEGHVSVVRASIAPIKKEVHALDFLAEESPDRLTLVVGTRNYSSWSMRPWLLLRHMGVAFEERDVAVLGKGPNAGLKDLSPSGLVPVLIVQPLTAAGAVAGGAAARVEAGGDAEVLRVWETVAIAEYLHERYPGRGVWPTDRAARAMARAVSCEMAAGFGALRGEMPCNIKMRTKGYPTPFPTALARDIGRIVELVESARARFGAPSGAGPFLFGAFCAADAMYAPVATRLRTYSVELESAVARAYFAALLDDAHFREWERVALTEEARGLALQHYDESTLTKGGGARE